MPCYHQQLAVRMPGKTKNGKSPMKFIGKARSYFTKYGGAPLGAMLLPCRQCIGCRLEYSRQWATRLIHETDFHKNAIFLTLTYDEDHVPKGGTLNPSHLTTFFKDLRARMDHYGKEKIKYFACGEYGDRTLRPHYHAALFGPFSCHAEDRGRHEEEPSRSGGLQYSHDDISAVWPFGLHRFSEHTFETAAYVARYVLKKVSGILAPDHYGDRHPEFVRMSKGLGKQHLQRWKEDVYPADHIVLPGRGAFMPPPYYDRLLEKVDPGLFQKIKVARQEAQDPIETTEDWLQEIYQRTISEEVRTLVTEQTLIRNI